MKRHNYSIVAGRRGRPLDTGSAGPRQVISEILEALKQDPKPVFTEFLHETAEKLKLPWPYVSEICWRLINDGTLHLTTDFRMEQRGEFLVPDMTPATGRISVEPQVDCWAA